VGPDISDAARHEGSEGTGAVHLLRGERAFIYAEHSPYYVAVFTKSFDVAMSPSHDMHHKDVDREGGKASERCEVLCVNETVYIQDVGLPYSAVLPLELGPF
jgi:hypothetical protein